jgi:hypothetical protein
MRFSQWYFESQISYSKDFYEPGLDFWDQESAYLAQESKYISMDSFISFATQVVSQAIQSANVPKGTKFDHGVKIASRMVANIVQNKGARGVKIRPVSVVLYNDPEDRGSGGGMAKGRGGNNTVYINLAHPYSKEKEVNDVIAHEIVHVFDPYLSKGLNSNDTYAKYQDYRNSREERTANLQQMANAAGAQSSKFLLNTPFYPTQQDLQSAYQRRTDNLMANANQEADPYVSMNPDDRRRYLKMVAKYKNKNAPLHDMIGDKRPNAYGAVTDMDKAYNQNLQKHNKDQAWRKSLMGKIFGWSSKPVPMPDRPYDDSEQAQNNAQALYGDKRKVRLSPVLQQMYQPPSHNAVTPYLDES